MLKVPGVTIEKRIATVGARTTGFDYLRIVLAVSIIAWHSIIVSYGAAVEAVAWRSPIGIAFRFVLPMFFALSGYLVAGSLDRCRTLVSFFGLRVLRIVPALAVEVTLSALIFGPLLTSLPLGEYFASAELHRYFLNVVGDIHFLLPGLFESNPLPRIVNNQLWTIPFELECYLALGGLAAAGLIRSRWLLLAVAVAGQIVWGVHADAMAAAHVPRSPLASGEALIVAFLVGIVIHLFRERIRLHWAIFALCAAGAWLLAGLPNGGIYLPFPAAYMTVYLGLQNPPTNWFLRSGDYSYGLYLYGYPIQQAVASAGPATREWWINLALVLPVALALAIVSWRFIEKPALGARKRVTAFETYALAMANRWTGAIGGPRALTRWIRPGVRVAAVLGVALLINGSLAAGALAIAAVFVAAVWLRLGDADWTGLAA